MIPVEISLIHYWSTCGLIRAQGDNQRVGGVPAASSKVPALGHQCPIATRSSNNLLCPEYFCSILCSPKHCSQWLIYTGLRPIDSDVGRNDKGKGNRATNMWTGNGNLINGRISITVEKCCIWGAYGGDVRI